MEYKSSELKELDPAILPTDVLLVKRKGKKLAGVKVSNLPSTPVPAGNASTFTVIGTTTVTTSGTPTAGAVVAPEPAPCTGLRSRNGGVPVEYQRKINGVFAGPFYRLIENEDFFVPGITDASDVGFRRADYATARPSTGTPNQVSSLTLQLITTSDVIVAANAAQTTTTNNNWIAFSSLPCVAADLKNVSTKDVFYRVKGGASIVLRRNSSKLETGLENMADIEIVSVDGVGAPTIVAQAYQAIPPSYLLADLKKAEMIADTASVQFGQPSGYMSRLQQSNFYIAQAAPFQPFMKERKVISFWDKAENTIVSSGTLADVALTDDQVFPTNANNTAVNITVNATGTLLSKTTNNAVKAVDCSKGIIELLSYRFGTTGTISAHKVRLYSEGSPSSPSANYHELDVTGDIGQGFSSANSIYPRSYCTSLFTAAGGNGANMGAILYGEDIVISSAAGAQIRPCEIAHVKKTSDAGTLFISCDDNGVAPLEVGRKTVAGKSIPFTFFPSPNAKNTGSFGTIPVDAMLKLQNSDKCAVGSQDYLNERNFDMTAQQWQRESQKNIQFLLSLGFSGDNARDFSPYGGGPYYLSGEQRKIMDRLYASSRRFDSPLNPSTAGDAVPMTYFVDTNPPGNPYEMRAFNLSGYANTATVAEVVAKLVQYAKMIADTQGSGGIAMHNDLSNPYYAAIWEGFLAGCEPMVAAGQLQFSTVAEQRRLSALVTDVDTEVATPVGATNTSRFFRARWRTTASVLASPTRVGLRNKTRQKIVIGNYDPVNILQWATTDVINSNRNPPTTGWVDIPPMSAETQPFNGKQFWIRPKVNGAACLTMIETVDYL